MTTISTAGSAQIQSWMVSELFVQPTAATDRQSDTPPADPFAATTSMTKVADGTAEAISNLKTGGGGERQKAAVSNAIVKGLNAMTSDQINTLLYNGKGTPFAGGLADSANWQFSDFIDLNHDTANLLRQHSTDMAYSASAQQSNAAGADALDAFTATLQAAYENHTLVFEKASDVQGLDFKENIHFSDDENYQATSDGYNINTDDINQNNLADHLLSIPGITLFMEW